MALMELFQQKKTPIRKIERFLIKVKVTVSKLRAFLENKLKSSEQEKSKRMTVTNLRAFLTKKNFREQDRSSNK